MIASTSQRRDFQCYTHGTPFSVCMDTGADCSLLSQRAFHKLQQLYNLTLIPETRTFSAVQGSPLDIIGSVLLPVSFHAHDTTFFVNFYIASNFILKCDALLGFDELAKHNISLFPKYQALNYNDVTYYATDHPVSVLTVKSRHAHFESSPHSRGDVSVPPPSLSDSSSNPKESKLSDPDTDYAAVVVGDQYIRPTCAQRITVRIRKAPVGSSVVSQPDSVRIKRLALESTLCSVRDDNMTDALVTNLTGSSVTIKNGAHLGSFTIVDDLSFQDPVPLIAAVSSQPASECTPAELATQLEAYTKDIDYPEVRARLTNLLVTHRKAIALPGEPLGVTDHVQHHIELKPGTRPIYVPSYRLPHSQRQIADDLVNSMLQEGIIHESHSPWNSPLFLVPKKDGSYRAVVDFRRVNAVTEPDHYPLPVLSELLQSIGKDNTVFTTLDLKSGFWQIPLSTDSRPITAFSTPTGHYEWARTPMGLRNSPLTAQRLVNSLFQGLIGKGLFVYIDDLILVSQDLDSHFQKLSLVLKKFAESGLKLNLPKCKFFKSSIQFLGHVVDKDGIHTTTDKVKAVENFPVPTTTAQVSSFLGIAGYYRAFIKNFASIASPLNKLKKKDVPFQWTDSQQQSFDQLKTALTQAPVLAFPDYSLPFLMCTDASALGLGAVLMQQVEGQRPHVIAYASRVLNDVESRYSVTNLEALAVVWSLKHFRDIIYNYPITVYTDHSAVTQLFKGRNLTGRLARWFLTIEEFQADIKHLPGRANLVADALSRNVAIAAISNIANFSLQDLAAAQRQDPIWSHVIYALESGDESHLLKLPVPLSEFHIHNEVLIRNVKIHDRNVVQLVIPESLVPTVLQLVHDAPQSGHPGRDKTLAMARAKYYWPKMRLDIVAHVSQCLSCASTKGNTSTAPILEYPTPVCPFDTVAIDLLSLPRSRQGSTSVLVCVDHFSRFVILAPLPNKSASAVAHALVTHLLCPYTTPSVLLSDNGAEFKNEVLKSICQQYNITQSFITAYHPASNGLVERVNKKILEILRHVAGRFQEAWQDWLPHVAASINGSINASTGKTPHYILYGCEKRLPYDLLLQPRVPVYSLEDYSKNQLRAFQEIHDSVRQTLQVSRTEMTRKQHIKAKPVTFQIHDVVFKSAPERQSKLTPKFIGPYIITDTLHGNKFKIYHCNNQTSEVVHADRLKKTNLSPPISLPSNVPISTSASTPSTSHYYLRSGAGK